MSTAELTDLEVAETYGQRIVDGLVAFAADSAYFVDMAERASLILYKRRLYEARKEAQTIEAAARAACAKEAKARPFLCVNAGACGFGACMFAKGEMKQVRAVGEDGAKERPDGVRARHQTYSLEGAIKALVERRGVAAPARLSRGRRTR